MNNRVKAVNTVMINISLAILSFIAVIPIYFMIISSLKTPDNVYSIPIQWIPNPVVWSNYLKLFTQYNFIRYFFNSMVVSVVTAVLNLIMSSMAGYGLAKFQFKGQKFIMAFIILTLLIPRESLVVPLYLVVRIIKFTDTLWALILPFAATPFGIFFMRQYIRSMPVSIIESARIDGSSEWKTYTSIIVPLIGPAFSALGIFSFMFNWNNFLWPMIILKTRDKMTLPLGISLMQGEYSTAYNELLAAATFSAIPILLLYFLLQKRFINSVLMSGIKE
jgi:ABC-type glycerol-3-phosphate transport system permease component